MSSITNGLDGDISYDPSTDTYHSQHDTESSESLCVKIIMTVSAATGQKADALDPIYSVVDPDALEACISHTGGDGVDISFSYEECTVNIASGGEIVVQSDK